MLYIFSYALYYANVSEAHGRIHNTWTNERETVSASVEVQQYLLRLTLRIQHSNAALGQASQYQSVGLPALRGSVQRNVSSVMAKRLFKGRHLRIQVN